MAHVVDGDGHVSRYLAAQPELNTSLEFNADSGVLYDASMAAKAHAGTALVAGAGMSRATAAKYAQFVGPGMLSGLLVAPRSVEHDKNKAPATSMVSQLTKLSDALRLGNKHTEMTWIGPKNPELGLTEADTSRYHGMASMLEVDDGLVDSASGAEVSVVLPMKICGALASMGYDSRTVHNVGKLVRNNMMSADAPATDKPMAFSSISSEVEKMLEGLFKPWWPNPKRARSVNFNSNEPVLLVNDFGRCGSLKLGAVVSETLDQLQRLHNIWPVRVYAGNFIEGEQSDFSITLLNVVNTDIGGPSMIQLLDHPCSTLGWNGCMRREVWNGRDLLERYDKTDDEVATGLQSLELDESEESTESAGDTDDADDDDSDGALEAADDPDPDKAPFDYQDPYANRAPVRHPSWGHSTRHESLLDVVKQQASIDSSGAQAGDSPKSEAGSLDKTSEKKRRTESTSSEGFIVL
jgi:hypothetical protein